MTIAIPSAEPKQKVGTESVDATIFGDVEVIIKLEVSLHPFASVTSTLFKPTHKLAPELSTSGTEAVYQS